MESTIRTIRTLNLGGRSLQLALYLTATAEESSPAFEQRALAELLAIITHHAPSLQLCCLRAKHAAPAHVPAALLTAVEGLLSEEGLACAGATLSAVLQVRPQRTRFATLAMPSAGAGFVSLPTAGIELTARVVTKAYQRQKTLVKLGFAAKA